MLLELLVPRTDAWLPTSLWYQAKDLQETNQLGWFNQLNYESTNLVDPKTGLFDPYSKESWSTYYHLLNDLAQKLGLRIFEAKSGIYAFNTNFIFDSRALDYLDRLIVPHEHIQAIREEAFEEVVNSLRIPSVSIVW
jgi:hypothetical protein